VLFGEILATHLQVPATARRTWIERKIWLDWDSGS
jgi:hypothetical protein